jgi:hypothetical protein
MTKSVPGTGCHRKRNKSIIYHSIRQQLQRLQEYVLEKKNDVDNSCNMQW